MMPILRLTPSLFAILFLLSFANPALAQPKSKPAITLFVPAYFYPAGDGLKEWDKLIAAATQVPIVAIANPASGPGERIDANYTSVVSRGKKAGVIVIGYVTTSYAKRPIEHVKSDVDTWRRLYPDVGGIFFDEQTSDRSQLEYYRDLFDYARTKLNNGFVASNPGVPCDAAYFASSRPDVISIFEHHHGFDQFMPGDGLGDIERRHSAVLPYDTRGAAQMRQRLKRTGELRLGFFYSTDDAGANPWDRLPTYWDDEVAAVKEVNGAALK